MSSVKDRMGITRIACVLFSLSSLYTQFYIKSSNGREDDRRREEKGGKGEKDWIAVE
jgi:hypothetical protein